MPYIEFVGPPGSGKTTAARALLATDPELAAGRRTLANASNELKVGCLGFPPGLRNFLLLLAGLPSDLLLVVSFAGGLSAPLRTRLKRSLILWLLLTKSRLLSASAVYWVIDQGLQQHILACRARHWLTMQQALWWRDRCMKAPYAAAQLRHVNLSFEELSQRLEASEKHRAQLDGLSLSEYTTRNLAAYRELYGAPSAV